MNDPKIMRLIKLMLKANGKTGVPQGGIISPLFSNIYLNGRGKMFERAIRETKRKGYQNIEYCRFADDIVILVNGYGVLKWLMDKCYKRLTEEIKKLKVNLNVEKTKILDMSNGETFTFLGFEYRLVNNKNKKRVLIKPRKKKVAELISKVKVHLAQNKDKTSIGHCSGTLTYVKIWVERKVRRFDRKHKLLEEVSN